MVINYKRQRDSEKKKMQYQNLKIYLIIILSNTFNLKSIFFKKRNKKDISQDLENTFKI